MEELSKQRRIQSAAVALFQEQGIDSTSVNEIVKRANVAKGTFYVYYKDKKELITQILIQKQGLMLNELLHRAQTKAQTQACSWGEAFVKELLQYYIENPDILMMIEKNISEFMDTMEHRKKVFSYVACFEDFVCDIQKADETRYDTICRFMLMMEIAGVVCHNAIIYDMPCPIDYIYQAISSTLTHIIND